MNRIRSIFVYGSLWFLLLGVSLAPVAAHAVGEPKPGDASHKRPKTMRLFGQEAPWITIALKHKADLDLTDDQVATLEKIRKEHSEQARPVADQLRGIENEIATLLNESPANLIAVKGKIQEAEKLRSELRYLRIEALENGKSVLTAEQKEKLRDLFAATHRGSRHSQPS